MNADESFRLALEGIAARGHLARGFITTPLVESDALHLGLQRTRALLDAVGAPDRAFPIVHIAGSKGKGSTAAFTAAIARAAGYRSGLFTSPHLHSFRERIVLDGEPITQETFGQTFAQVQQGTIALEEKRPELGTVTAFELLTVMALLAFADAGCQLGVVEVGLGGTFDSTNVVSPVVSVITRLDFEHTQLLGETLAEIAANKAGIIKPHTPVITASQEATALQVIARTAAEGHAPLAIAGADFAGWGDWRSFTWQSADRRITHLRTGMPGWHQVENAALSIAAWQALARRGLHASDDAIRTGVANAVLPGRFERIEAWGRTWVLDGAHTPVAASALADTILIEFGRPVGAIVGLLSDKLPRSFVEALVPAVAGWIVTQPDNPRAYSVQALVPTVRAVDSQAVASDDLETALLTARKRFPNDLPVLITGSFSLVAEARKRFGLALLDL